MYNELERLKYLLIKKEITYSEFNELIGSYYISDYEELEDGYYILSIISPVYSLSKREEDDYYTDFIHIIN